MTRDEFTQKFRWHMVMWLVGVVNVIALIPQPLSMLRTGVVAGVTWQTYAIFALVQVVFGIEFYLKQSWGGVVSMALSFCLSMLTIMLYFAYS